MSKSVFFRGLSLLGLAFVMIACPAPGAEDALLGELNADGVKVTQEMIDAGTAGKKPASAGTDGAGGGADSVTKEELKKVSDSISTMITEAKGTIDTTSGHAVAMKIVSIMKASQPYGSCTLFGADALAGVLNKASNAAIDSSIKDATMFGPLKVEGATFGGKGTFEIKAYEKAADVATGKIAETGKAVIAGKLAASAVFQYVYDKFTLDGKYFLDGTLAFTQESAAGAVGDSKFKVIEADAKLTLSEGTEQIATIAFEKDFVYEAKFANCAKPTVVDNGIAVLMFAADMKSITIAPAGAAKFTPVVMKVTKKAEKDKARVLGTNLELFSILLGPKNYLAMKNS